MGKKYFFKNIKTLFATMMKTSLVFQDEMKFYGENVATPGTCGTP